MNIIFHVIFSKTTNESECDSAASGRIYVRLIGSQSFAWLSDGAVAVACLLMYIHILFMCRLEVSPSNLPRLVETSSPVANL